MPVLVRYCLESLWPPFVLAVFSTTFVLNLLFYLLEFLDYLLVKQAGVLNSILLLVYIQPSFLVVALPIGFLTAVLVVFGRLGADREMMALETCGFSSWVLIWPMTAVSLLVSLLLVVFMDLVLPWGNTSFLKLQYAIISERSAVAIRERTFINDFKGYVIRVDQKDEGRDILKNVVVEVLDEKDHPTRLILAREGTIRRDPRDSHEKLQLKNGTMQQLGTPKIPNPAHLLQMQFETCELDLDSKRMQMGAMNFQGEGLNMHLGELAAQIRKGRKENKDTRQWEVEFHKKFSIPFSALAFALIGMPLGLLSKTGSLMSPVLAVVLVVVYNLFMMYGEVGGPMGAISPFLAMWLPNVVLSVLGFWLIYHLNHKFWKAGFGARLQRRGDDPGTSGIPGKK